MGERLAECFESRFSLRWHDAPPATRIDEVQLQHLARTTKHTLSTEQLVLAEVTRGERQLKVPMTRSEFEDLTADLLERTIFTTRQTLAAAKLVWNEVDRILLVGGSSRMPAIRRALHDMSSITADAAVNPDEAVARGAAIYARYLLAQQGDGNAVPKLRITDVNSHSLGIEGVNLETLLAENVALIPRNSPLLCEINRSFVTRHDNQPNVKVQLLEGESSLPNHCSRLATATIKNLPLGLPQGTSIEVKYSLQSNGRLAVSASVPGHGANAQIELQRVHGLNDRRVQRWKTIVCRDGGYRDYHDAVASLLAQAPDPDDDWDFDLANTAKTPRQRTNLDPAVDFGAPLAASDAIHDHFRATAARPSASYQPTPTPRTFDEASADYDFASSKPARSTRRKGTSPAKLVIGTIGGGILGIAIGYYLLCLVRPDLNHLELNLPGVRAPSSPNRDR